LFIKSHFRTNARSVFHLNQCTQGCVWLWTVAPFKVSRWGCEWFDWR